LRVKVHARDVGGDLPREARYDVGAPAAGAGAHGSPGPQARGVLARRLPIEPRGRHLLPGGEHAPRHDAHQPPPPGRPGCGDRVSGAVRADLPGRGAFVRYYLLCGLGGAVLSLVLGWGFGRINPVVGASAAVYGVLLAFAWAAPDAPINVLFFPAPIAAKWLVTFLVAVSLMLAL